jgi:hypothetical protein
MDGQTDDGTKRTKPIVHIFKMFSKKREKTLVKHFHKKFRNVKIYNWKKNSSETNTFHISYVAEILVPEVFYANLIVLHTQNFEI